MADRLGADIDADFVVKPAAGIFPARLPCQRQSPLAKMLFQKGIIESSQVADPLDAQRMQALLGDFAHPGYVAHIEGGEESGFLSGNYPQDAMWLGLRRRNLGDQAGRADTDRTIELGFRLDLLMETVSGGQRRSMQAFGSGHVEVGFVDGCHFDQRRESGEHVMNFL